jgi:hypothetical protein
VIYKSLHFTKIIFFERVVKNLALLQAEASDSGWGLANVPNVRWDFYSVISILFFGFCSNVLILCVFLRLWLTVGGCEQWGMTWRSVVIRR